MKAVAFNCSPKADNGNTALILNPLLEGIREGGAEVEVFYTNKLKINPCRGDLHCLFKTPGKCFQNDDMQMLLPKLRNADIWIFATPVYIDGIISSMKILMERMLPMVDPLVEIRGGHCRYSLRQDTQQGKVVLVSTCGNWEIDNFNPLIVHMEAACENIGRKLELALLRPHAAILKPIIQADSQFNDIFEAAKEAGQQLVENGVVLPETLNIISRELMPLDMYVRMYNQNVQQIFKAHEKE